jgi:hypothetical protein
LTTAVLEVENLDTTGNSDVPAILISNSADSADIRYPVRTTNPGTLGEGDTWLFHDTAASPDQYYLRAYINGAVRQVELT